MRFILPSPRLRGEVPKRKRRGWGAALVNVLTPEIFSMSALQMRPHPALAGEVPRSGGGGISVLSHLRLRVHQMAASIRQSQNFVMMDNDSPSALAGTSPASGVRT